MGVSPSGSEGSSEAGVESASQCSAERDPRADRADSDSAKHPSSMSSSNSAAVNRHGHAASIENDSDEDSELEDGGKVSSAKWIGISQSSWPFEPRPGEVITSISSAAAPCSSASEEVDGTMSPPEGVADLEACRSSSPISVRRASYTKLQPSVLRERMRRDDNSEGNRYITDIDL